MTSESYLHDGSQKLSNSVQPTEQAVPLSDRSPSPQRLGITATAAVTPDSADRASGGSRATRARSLSSDGSSEFGSSRLRELRSQRNAKLGALKERIRRTSHNALATPDTALAKSKHRSESGSHLNSEVDSIHSGTSSANSRNSDYQHSPRILELRARRKQRLDEYRSRSPSAEDAPPPVITLNGSDVLSRETIDGADLIGNSASVDNYKANSALSNGHNSDDKFSTPIQPSPLRQDSVPRFDRRTPGRRTGLKRRSSAPNVYRGITEEMLDDEMLSGLSKLDRLRLRRAQIHEKAKMANAAVSRLTEEALSEHKYDDAFAMSDEIPKPSRVTEDGLSSVASGAPRRRAALRRRSSAPKVYKGITEEMLNDEMLTGLSKLDRLRLRRAQSQEKAQLANAAVSRLTEEAFSEHQNDETLKPSPVTQDDSILSEHKNDDTSDLLDEIPNPVRRDSVPSFDHRAPGRRRAVRRRSSAPNVFKGITEEMLDDDTLSGLSKLDRLRLRRAQIREKAKMANAAVSRLTEEVLLSEHNHDEAPAMSDDIPKPSPVVTQDSVPSIASGVPRRRAALRRRSSAPNVYKGITEEMLDDEMLSGLSKLDRLRLRRAQTQEKAQLANAAVNRLKEGAFSEQLAKQLLDVRKERAELQRELEINRAALQRARGKKLSDSKTEAEDDTFGMCNMIDELQGQVDKLEDRKIDDDIRVEEALHKTRLEVAQLKEQLQETQLNLSKIRRENQELNHQNQQQQVRHVNVTKMWEHRVEGLVSQLRDLQYSLQDLSHARLQERSDLLRHVVLLQKENQRLRNGGKENPRITSRKPGMASSFGNSLKFMPFGSLLAGRSHTVKVTGNTWHPMKQASESKVKSRHGVSTFLKRCTGLMTWDTMKNVAFGAGIMGLVLVSSDPQVTHEAGPFLRLEISPPLFNLAEFK